MSAPAKSVAARHAFRRLLSAIVAALMVAFACMPASAIADNGNDNLVDPTQRADNSFIYDTTIESLFEQASIYDGRTVQVVGEAIGDRIRSTGDPGYYWITLTSIDSEDKSTISVLLSEDQSNLIDRYGKYGVTGTTLQVRGSYHQACDEHDGLPDIHATNSSVVSRGIDHSDQFDPSDFVPGILAVLMGIALMGAFYFARERTR